MTARYGTLVSNVACRRQENVLDGTDYGLGGRVHPQIALAKLRDGAAIASKKLRS